MSEKSRSICVKVSPLLISLLIFQFSMAQYNFIGLDQKLSTVRKELGNQFITMIYKDGKIIYQKSFGEFTPKTQAPITCSSQWLTAALVMSFVDQGKLSLDDKVSKYIPLFSKYSKGYITIRDCLSHMTGIEADPNILKKLTEKRSFASLEDEVTDFASKKDIQTNPGLEFRFSNIGLNIAARVVEIIGRRGFEQLMQERITRPLLMRNTSFSSMDAVNPSAVAESTANDYMNFMIMLLDKGTFNGKQILSEHAIQEMQHIRTNSSIIKLCPKLTEGFNYGLGEWIQDTDEQGNATVISCPSLMGTWPMIDRCRGYACIIFTNGQLKDTPKGIYKEIKSVIDEQFPAACK